MTAVLLFRHKSTNQDGDIIEMVVWRIPLSLQYPERVRYRHKHLRQIEMPYPFVNEDQLQLDFENDIKAWKEKA